MITMLICEDDTYNYDYKIYNDDDNIIAADGKDEIIKIDNTTGIVRI